MRRLFYCLLALALAAAMCLPLAVFSSAAVEDGFTMQIPLAESLAALRKNKRLDLLDFPGGDYTLSLRRLDDNGLRWVRLVIAREDTFYGTVSLGTWEQLQDLDSLQIDVVFQQSRAEFAMTSLPDKHRRGAIALPMSLGGVPSLSEFSEAQGIELKPRVTEEETEAAAVAAAANPRQQGNPDAPKRETVGAGPYALALLLLALVLAALILGQMFGRKWLLALRERYQMLVLLLNNFRDSRRLPRKQVIALPPGPEQQLLPNPAYDSTQILMNSSELPRMEHFAAEKDDGQKSVLAGITLMPPTEQSSLLRRILMREEEEAAPPSQEEQEEIMQAYFQSRARLPGYRFLTVGLSNRDTLQQLGSESVRPLFAPNPRGQLFSVEEESGNLYLHVEYFAPPSFVLQSVLRSVCLERIFVCVNANGEEMAPEDAANRFIAEIIPARTTRTEAGFILTEKGQLKIGKS